MIDEGYTAADHAFRDRDPYAGAKYDITLRWLGPGDGRRLLNIGCGAGRFTAMADAAGFVVDACEPDPAACAVAVAAAPPRATVHEAGLFDAPFAPGADVVVMHDVLEHIADEEAAVRRLADLIGAHGRLVLSVPALPALFGAHDEQLGHHRRYTKPMLRRALAPHFDVRRLRYFGMTFIPVTAWYSTWGRGPYPTGEGDGSSLIGRAFGAACRLESHVPTPVGTSLVVDAVPRQ